MLGTCGECGNQLSSNAASCPHCGNVIREQGTAVVVQQVEKTANWSPGVAAILSFLLPGLGQMYKGQIFNGLGWFVLTAIGYVCFVIPGVVLHLCCIFGAASGDPYKR